MTISQTEAQAAQLSAHLAHTQQQLTDQRAAACQPSAAAKRQARTHIATICNGEWLDTHTARFIYLARRSMPDATFHLLHIGDEADLAKSKTPDQFDSVKSATIADKDAPGYLAYNAPRYGLCSLLGLDELIYLDPDVDVVADISHALDDCEGALGWCRSPVEPSGFSDGLKKLELPVPKVWANSGTLVMRGDFSGQYMAAAARAVEAGVDPRMVGNFAFSVMLQSGGVDHRQIPYKYGTIWWDVNPINERGDSAYSRALCLHYCNDKGKARRLALDSVWCG